MTYAAFQDAIKSLGSIDDIKNLSMVLHFRIGTHGSKDAPGHTHPFPLSNSYPDMQKLVSDCPMAIAHNGIIAFTKGIVEGFRTYPYVKKDADTLDPSDTMEAIKNLLYPLSSIPGWGKDEKIRAIISSVIGSSRLALLFADGGVITFGDFIEGFDCQWSNGSFKVTPPVAPTVYPDNNYTNYWDKNGCYHGWLYDDIEDGPERHPLLNYGKGGEAKSDIRPPVQVFIDDFREAAHAREQWLGELWPGKASAYQILVAEGYWTFYTPSKVWYTPSWGETEKCLKIIDPAIPYYLSHEQKYLYTFDVKVGALILLGTVSEWCELKPKNIGGYLHGPYDFRTKDIKDSVKL
jgi:hypothetical protein